MIMPSQETEFVEIGGCAIDFSNYSLHLVGDGQKYKNWDIEIIPQKYNEQPEYWELHVIGKKLNEQQAPKPTWQTWQIHLLLKEYERPLDQDTLQVKEGIEKALSKKFHQVGGKISVLGTKGIKVVGKNRIITIDIEEKNQDDKKSP